LRKWNDSASIIDQFVGEFNRLTHNDFLQTNGSILLPASPVRTGCNRCFAHRNYPNVLIIDRRGKIAFHSGIAPKKPDAYMEEMGELLLMAEQLKMTTDLYSPAKDASKAK
jgi:hypothetical protein